PDRGIPAGARSSRPLARRGVGARGALPPPREPAAAVGRPDRREGYLPGRRLPHRGRFATAAGTVRRAGGDGRARSPRGRRPHPRQDCHDRVRRRGAGADPQPARARPHAGRVEQRLGGGGRGRFLHARTRLADDRLGDSPRRLLRGGRHEAELRADSPRRRHPLRPLGRSRRLFHAGRRRGTARRLAPLPRLEARAGAGRRGPAPDPRRTRRPLPRPGRAGGSRRFRGPARAAARGRLPGAAGAPLRRHRGDQPAAPAAHHGGTGTNPRPLVRDLRGALPAAHRRANSRRTDGQGRGIGRGAGGTRGAPCRSGGDDGRGRDRSVGQPRRARPRAPRSRLDRFLDHEPALDLRRAAGHLPPGRPKRGGPAARLAARRAAGRRRGAARLGRTTGRDRGWRRRRADL
ncbi:MAG: Aspartyl-tRNA(Asn) amidotransferase subunit A @ Glutamyl-tRNA(Gln) amidotransferase subunit A, partial [uncultured Thermomicrobiales bacterium]